MMKTQLAVILSLTAGLSLTLPGQAGAEQVRASAGARIGAGDHVVVRTPPPRRAGFRIGIEGGMSISVFADPPPPPPPTPVVVVPSVYVQPAHIVTVAPVVPAVVLAPEPEPPRFGVGAFAGATDVDGRDAGSDLGVLARFRLTRHLELEAEVAKSKLPVGGRVDKRFGAAIMYDFRPLHTLSPYLLAGAGYGRAEAEAGSLRADQGYGELGIGLSWRIGEHLQLIGDIRAGRRHTADAGSLYADDVMPSYHRPIDETEDYSRGRIGALLYF